MARVLKGEIEAIIQGWIEAALAVWRKEIDDLSFFILGFLATIGRSLREFSI